MRTKYTDVNKQYRKLLHNVLQPRRTRCKTKQIALDQISDRELSRKVRVKVTKNLDSPFARAQYLEKGNIVLLHPVNIFARAGDIRDTIDHEITHYKDESRRRPRAREY